MSHIGLTPEPNTIKRIFESIDVLPTKEYADEMDNIDPLKRFRYDFNIPIASNDCSRKEAIYLCGFGLGLQPKSTLNNLKEACTEWGKLGALSYTDGKRPLRYCEIRSEELLMPIMGANSIKEIAVMNACSVNANLLMTSFYRPTSKRYKILIEGGAFCSDYHIIKGQMNLHNITQPDALIEIYPISEENKSNYIIDNQQFINAIHKHNESITMIWLGCTQHLTGQLFDIKSICDTAHKYGIYVGLDLAHGIGNVPLYLHDWGVDFASFCGYKYLNGSGGAIGGIFVHDKHFCNQALKKQSGWWGQDLVERYKFISDFTPSVGAKSWAISQTPLFQCVALESSLEIFQKAGGILNLREKSIKLTGYLQLLIETYLNEHIKIITPANINERGCQLSLAVFGVGNVVGGLNKWLLQNGVICSTRHLGNVGIIRVAPTPLYNTFRECWDFVNIVKTYLDNRSRSSKL